MIEKRIRRKIGAIKHALTWPIKNFTAGTFKLIIPPFKNEVYSQSILLMKHRPEYTQDHRNLKVFHQEIQNAVQSRTNLV